MGAIANAGSPIPNVPFSSLPASVPLNGTGSTAGAGAIDQYQWTLIHYPTGSTVAFSSSTAASPTLNNVDTPGGYYIALNVHDTVDGWAWDPDPTSGALQNLPNTMPTALIMVNAELNYTSLVPVALGERTTQDLTSADPGYMNAWGKLYALWRAVDGLQGQVDAIGSTPTFDTIYVDNINEKTAAHGIYMNDEVFMWDDVQIATGKALTTNAINAHLASAMTIASGDDLDVSATAALTASGLSVTLTAGIANSVVARGGPLYPDLLVDVIGEDTVGSGVTVDGVLLKDGDVTTATATDKVKTNLIEAGAVAGGVTTLGISAAGALSLTTSAGGDITANASDDISLVAGDDFSLSANAGAASFTMDGGLGNATIAATNDAQLAGANSAAVTSSAGDITISAFDDCQLGAGAGTTTIVMDGGAKTISLTADNGVSGTGLMRGFVYAITGTDSKGTSTSSEVAFTNKALIPADTLAVNDNISVRLVVKLANSDGASSFVSRIRIGGLAGLEVASCNNASMAADAVSECRFSGRVSAIGATLGLSGVTYTIVAIDETGSPAAPNTGSFPGGDPGAGPDTTANISVVGTVEFSGSSASNSATIQALEVVITRNT